MALLATSPEVSQEPGSRRVRDSLSRLVVVVAVLDVLTIAAAAAAAIGIKFGYGTWPPSHIEWFTGIPPIDFGWVVPVWWGALALSDAYERREIARGSDEFKSILRASFAAAGVVAMLAYLVNYDMSRPYFALTWTLGTAGLFLERYAVRRVVTRLRVRQQLQHRVVVVGDAVAVRELDAALAREPGLGYALVGACVAGPREPLPVPVLGEPSGAVRACVDHDADTLLIASGSFASSVDLRQVGWELEGRDIDLIVVPNLIDVAGPRIHLRPVAGLPFVHVEPPQVARAMRWSKAVVDRLGALLLLVVLAPVFLAAALAVRADGGPVFYRHRRVGLDGRELWVWKFRSMRPGADQVQDALMDDLGADPLLFKVRDDPRVTPVGRLLRRYSVDELPQLLNVLAGQMSLVGPRPQVAAEVAQYSHTMHRRLRVRPGITGLWQVSGRSDLTPEEAARLDLYYVENWSMAGDLMILARTVRAVLRHDGAY
jgi:exopolysaccharide biosynthesis polyprenyl glycosylphosphotransferase